MVYTTIDLPKLVKEAQNKNKNSMTYIIEAIQHYNLEATPGFYDFLDQIEGSSRRS
ncbi:hypothetical protein [Aneurinibacillus migulanus]|uniref:Uncharacterized protein n=1 Tax=Aneurinibacillus migulanus TaxID=47500 RepID=A0A1G8T676_ANEMI|nr:hypothetical protein [Aneurinibacillus migulanus]MED0894384.1 hypothetical protein [Aneurinibacillus migulanus]MED1616994.1 hypothetical protein [Aneurinibacillus migulanus]GED16918.1 hypothetical protein AMI01nite_49090 [Aneurinibacillus migulanus]SDJ36998.1 hypothetical protein SAMN04487909_116102 [Aneurinibacillus migulanus]